MIDINFKKQQDGLVPAIIQDAETRQVLMLGYMNEAALAETLKSGKVTFYSRSKKRLWTKGEESGHFLKLVDLKADCDQDTILLRAIPQGPSCHKGTDTCWGEENSGFLQRLENIISERRETAAQDSYVASLFREGINKMARKLGEETIETIIEAKDSDDTLFLNESADLLFHFLILLQAKGFRLPDVERVLEERHSPAP